jgi:hypothetical protein
MGHPPELQCSLQGIRAEHKNNHQQRSNTMFYDPLGLSKAKTIRAMNGAYQANVRIDHLTHEKLKHIQAYYQSALDKKTVNVGAILRRAISLLSDHVDDLIIHERRGNIATVRAEESILKQCAEGEKCKQLKDASGFSQFPTFAELMKKGSKEYDPTEFNKSLK